MLIDSHCHLADKRLSGQLEEVLERSRGAGVTQWVVASASIDDWDRLLALSNTHAGVHAAFGIHPWYCDRHQTSHLLILRGFLEQAVAVGECGLDFGPNRPTQALQENWLCQQLRLAKEFEKPVILHAYKSLDRLIAIIEQMPGIRGVVHGFVGSRQQAERLIARGFYLGLGTMLLKSNRLRGLANELPLEALLIESDAPDQSLDANRLNEPAVLPHILAQLACIRAIAPEQLALQLNANAARLFSLQTSHNGAKA
ncbi:MAG: TatD family deoxyribonuclease [Zetaproteobacteria bacterium]|nr:MAG: TatD family deoxyribonuclease [Zetaproteobacteria bacterium]